MSRIYAVDPGAVATGIASLDTWTNDFHAKQCTSPLGAWGALQYEISSRRSESMDVLLIEDFSSGGHLTKEARKTIGIVDFFYYASFHYLWDSVDVYMRSPQHRLSGQREAAELMGSTIEKLKVDPEKKDAFSALSHCCTYRRTIL